MFLLQIAMSAASFFSPKLFLMHIMNLDKRSKSCEDRWVRLELAGLFVSIIYYRAAVAE